MKTIEIVVSPAGATHVETKGFAGSECRQASQFLEQALGRRVEERLTGAYYAQQSQSQPQQEQA
jgi:hypothetical protein